MNRVYLGLAATVFSVLFIAGCATVDDNTNNASKQSNSRVTDIDVEAFLKSNTNKDKEEKSLAPDINATVVEAVGIGATQDEAQKNALYSAVEQVVGAIVDAKTQIDNDKVVKDQILTMSAGYVEDYKVIGTPIQKDGKCEIMIRAKVRRTKLLCDLEDKNVTIKSEVKGEALWAQAVTQGRVKEQADKILEALLSDDPRKFRVEQISQAVLIPPAELTEAELAISDSWIRVKLRVYVDKAYFNKTFLTKLCACLDALVKGDRKYESLAVPDGRAFCLDGKEIDYNGGWLRGLEGGRLAGCRLQPLISATAICRSFMIHSGAERDNEWSAVWQSLRIHNFPESMSSFGMSTVTSYVIPPYYLRIFKSKLSIPVRKEILMEFVDNSNVVVASHQMLFEFPPFCVGDHIEILPAMIYRMDSYQRALYFFDQMDVIVSLPVDASVVKSIKSAKITIVDAPAKIE